MWFEVILLCYPDNGVKLQATLYIAMRGLIIARQERRKLIKGRKDNIKSGGGAN